MLLPVIVPQNDKPLSSNLRKTCKDVAGVLSKDTVFLKQLTLEGTAGGLTADVTVMPSWVGAEGLPLPQTRWRSPGASIGGLVQLGLLAPPETCSRLVPT